MTSSASGPRRRRHLTRATRRRSLYRGFPRRDACHAGDLPKTQVAISGGRLTVDDLNEGLALATSGAIEKVYAAIVSILVDAGASSFANILTTALIQIHDYQTEPLIGCFPDPACARELLTAGADPDVSGSFRKNPLERTMGDRPAAPVLAELLLAHGARLEPELLFLPLVGRKSSGTVMTKFLLDRGLDPNTISEIWGTPLHLAVYRNMLSSYC
ncbi:uncharacterized protein RSE6_03432 [Rhynchosporium secalis]|uniref:Ankyrin n=1 Tax=Rhynchosporium secalis TaxID=38038 RepID=A0A1E1M2R6_RHYSE|nr:uncharacterized protein RSE6_03432 [Rhynchosporium secalis]